MYAIKLSYGDVGDEPEMATAEIIGTYESLDEACEAAESKFDAILERLTGGEDICFGAVESGCCDHYVTYGDSVYKSGRVSSGYDYYYMVNVVER